MQALLCCLTSPCKASSPELKSTPLKFKETTHRSFIYKGRRSNNWSYRSEGGTPHNTTLPVRNNLVDPDELIFAFEAILCINNNTSGS